MKSISTSVLLAFPCMLFAQEVHQKKLSIKGSVDAYFRSNISGFNEVFEDDDGQTIFLNPGTWFADRSGFSFGMANVILSYDGEKVGFVADVVFGPRGEDAVFLSVGSSQIINHLYAYWNVSDSVRLNLGNFNYSTSYRFSNGPFSHTGIKAEIGLSDDFSLLLAVMNSTDYTEINLDGSYTLGAQLGFKNQFLNVTYDNQTGNSKPTFQIDYTGGSALSDTFFLGINTTYNDTGGNGFYGAALYPKYTVSDALGFGARVEYFGFHNVDVNDDNVFATTLSVNYKIADLTITPEVRLDNWNDDLEPSKNLSSFLIAAVSEF